MTFPKISGRKIFPAILLALFLISGACGLMYEVVWLRVMGLVFGNTTFAISTVLAGYMAGLGLGALYFGRWIDRHKNPVLTYGLLEGGVALYAFLTPLLWKLTELIHIGFYRTFDPSFFVLSLFKFLTAFIALFVPTFLMGGTLPVLSTYFVRQPQDTARKVGLLYALNTFGAVAGVAFSGFFSLYLLGVLETVYLTGILNLIICATCVVSARLIRTDGPAEPLPAGSKPAQTQAPGRPAPLRTALLVLFGLSGAVSMMYEIGWTRVLAIVLGSSVYAFSVMLATFLFGIALGSYLFSRLAKYFPVGLKTFALLQMFTAITALIGLNRMNDMPYYFVKIFGWFGGAVWPMEFGKFLLCSLVMAFPTLAIGAMFSCFIHIYRHTEGLGREIGTAYCANTVGTILGSALTGFFIIPAIGIRSTLLAASAINTLIGVVVFFFPPRNFNWKKITAGAAALCLAASCALAVEPWDRSLITSGTFIKPEYAVRLSRTAFRDSIADRETLFYKEGSNATVNVSRLKDTLSLAVNGKPDASTEDAFTQFLLGHLPMLLHPAPKKVLVIGIGSASTLAAVASYPVSAIHAVEIEPAVIEGARYFSRLNRNVLNDPRLKIMINDGRNILLLRPDRYDVIISEPSNPWMAGVANLFSLEHYRTMKERLEPDGVVCQWLHAYSMSRDDLRMIIRTFSEVFEDVSLWLPYFPDLMLIGRKKSAPVDFRHIEESFKNPVVAQDFRPYGILKPAGLFSCYWLGDQSLRQLSEGARTNSDDHPYLEFSAPRYLYQNTRLDNFSFLNSFWVPKLPPIANAQPPAVQNPEFYNEAARGMLAKKLTGNAEDLLKISRQLSPNNPGFVAVYGILNLEAGSLDEAAKALTAAAASTPPSAEAYFYLGMLFRRQFKLPLAIEAFRQAVGLEPENLKYVTALADALADSKMFAPALALYDRILTQKGSDFDILSRIADIIFAIGTPERKIAISEMIINQYPRFRPGYLRLGDFLAANGLFDRALDVYLKLKAQFPEDPQSYLLLGQVYEKIGRPEDMRKNIRKAIQLDRSLNSNPTIQSLLNS